MNHKPLLLVGLCLVASQAVSEVIFSEYIEGSSNNKALELMNTGLTAADLSQYRIELYSNGNTNVQNQLSLTGSLGAGEVYVIANSSAVPEILDVSDTTSSVTFFNGNDVLLLKQNDVVVDRIGQLGNSDTFGANVTLVRNADITVGDGDSSSPFDPAIEWTTYPQNTFSYLGDGDTGGDPGPVDPPGDLTCANPATLISEIQGAGSASSLEGEVLVVEAVVTVDLQSSDEMSGFFLQEQDSDADGDPLTSEGLFVYHNSDDVNVGDLVRIEATVDEFFGLTQLNQVKNLVVCDSAHPLP